MALVLNISNVLFTLIIGMSMSGILSKLGILEIIVDEITRKISSPRIIVLFSTISSLLFYGATGDSQPAKVLVSTAFSNVYEREKLDRTVLSRTIEMATFG